MTYDPIPYWLERGANYERRFKPARYAEQERTLAAVIDGLVFDSVLEVGCGFGRVGAIVKALRPDAKYTGIDLSPDLLNSARTRIPDGTFTSTSLADFPDNRQYDLVVAAEVLMHIQPEGVKFAVDKLLRLARCHLVTVDWTTPLAKAGEHNFVHDYAALFGQASAFPVGLQTVYRVRRPCAS